jgi:hypothetical protein
MGGIMSFLQSMGIANSAIRDLDARDRRDRAETSQLNEMDEMMMRRRTLRRAQEEFARGLYQPATGGAAPAAMPAPAAPGAKPAAPAMPPPGESAFDGIYDDAMVGGEQFPSIWLRLYEDMQQPDAEEMAPPPAPAPQGAQTFPMQALPMPMAKPVPFNQGGPVEGPGTGTSDSIPAMIDGQRPAALSDGEYVVPAAVVRAKGTEFFDRLKEKYMQPEGGK